MNIFIVYSHPSKQSYTFQVLEQLIEALIKEGHRIEISDLYEMNFQTDMTDKEYNREGFGDLDLPIESDVLAEHEKIEWADCLIFLYPVWWSDCPAKLKGWFDRVYAVGYAYGYDSSRQTIEQMKMIRVGQVICTAGHPNKFLKDTGITDSMKTIMLNDRLGRRFVYKEMTILGGTLNIKDVRQTHAGQIIGLAKQINSFFPDQENGNGKLR